MVVADARRFTRRTRPRARRLVRLAGRAASEREMNVGERGARRVAEGSRRLAGEPGEATGAEARLEVFGLARAVCRAAQLVARRAGTVAALEWVGGHAGEQRSAGLAAAGVVGSRRVDAASPLASLGCGRAGLTAQGRARRAAQLDDGLDPRPLAATAAACRGPEAEQQHEQRRAAGSARRRSATLPPRGPRGWCGKSARPFVRGMPGHGSTVWQIFEVRP